MSSSLTQSGAGADAVFTFDPSVFAGHMVEIWVAYNDGVNWNYYDMANGVWSTSPRSYQMIAQELELSLDTTGLATRELNVVVEADPDGIFSAGKLAWKKLTLQ